VHDGGGAYRVSVGGDREVLFTKNNGCGADFVISVLQAMLDVARMDPRFEGRGTDQIFQEVRRSSEMGLFALTCNVIKGPEGKKEIVSRVIELGARLYTTEMRLHNDSMSGAVIQAIVTSVSRQTRSSNPNMQTSTEMDAKLKVRVPIQYIQAIVGYLIICTNNLVGSDNKERFNTLSKVARSIPSCADAMDAAMAESETSAHHLRYGMKRYVPSSQHMTHILQSK
jgi:hypothetical protein